MSPSWTTEQKQVIDLRNRNLLVSAAAGSGKTAVLVERIIGLVTDPKHPVDIDRLLVVTFTKAAAAEMRERISNAIEAKKEADPANVNLNRQASLIHNAQICTIDSFCSFVVRNHFGEINLDPNFRIADEGERKLLEKDTMDELFEREFEAARPDFLALADAYSGKRNAEAVRDMVEKIYNISESCPWPQEWICDLEKPYRVETVDQMVKSEILQNAEMSIYRKIEHAVEEYRKLCREADQAAGLQKLAALLHTEMEMLEGGCEEKSYSDLIQFLDTVSFGRMPVIRKGPAVDTAAKDRIAEERTKIKDLIDNLKKTYTGAEPENILAQLKRMRPAVGELIHLTLEYIKLLEEHKQRKKIADFADIEHYALNILVDPNTRQCTKTAQEFRHHYEEIMIDEYQDSNQVQEEILCAISRMAEGRNNMFMVGDVKQSIYRFRQARPELFMAKYSSYSKEDSICQKIELHRNFRSRPEVLEFCNDMFYKLMQQDLGNITYDSDAALYPGALYPENDKINPEVLLFDRSSMDDADEETEEKLGEDKRQMEAAMVADRILRLIADTPVTDKKTGNLRPMRYSDIVILFRTLKDWGTSFAEVLQTRGIPAHVESSTGYFSAIEVQTVLNFLRILDNPYQDIPMAAVLKSGLAGLDDEELAEIRAAYPDLSFAGAVLERMKKEKGSSSEHNTSGELIRNDENAADVTEKLSGNGQMEESSSYTPLGKFAETFFHFRALSGELPIHELIQRILSETGYGNYVSCLPAGKNRSANLDMLVEKAIAYEATSYKGLFHFVRYIDQLQKYEVDYGEADTTAENADVVHIMTIHKSKGLEFPVVFVCGMFKEFNNMDAKDGLVLHPDLGLGLNEQTATPKIKRTGFLHTQIADRIITDNMGEELRVLYVALTRAKEKLILTGLIDDEEKLYKDHSGYVLENQPIPYEVRRNSKSFGDWIVCAILSWPEKYQLTIVKAEELLAPLARETAESQLDYAELLAKIREAEGEEGEILKRNIAYQYPFASEINRKSKYSVSEFKHASMVQKYDEEEGEAERPTFLLKEKESYIPEFARSEAEEPGSREEETGQLALLLEIDQEPVKGFEAEKPATGVQKKKNRDRQSEKIKSDDEEKHALGTTGRINVVPGVSIGALRGTAIHRVMECLDFAKILTINCSRKQEVKKFVREEIARMADAGLLTEDMKNLVIPTMIEDFVSAPVAVRMAIAAEKKLLFKEKPFVMLYQDVLVQGIIDVFWMEEDENGERSIVLLDYKTDRVENGKELMDRYQKQLELYAEALEHIFSSEDKQMEVRTSMLYSFHLKKEIVL